MADDNHPHRRYFAWLQSAAAPAFVHINKCGGISVEQALGLPYFLHYTVREQQASIGVARWRELFSFALVRHPFAKAVSHYFFRVKTDQTGLGDGHLDLNGWIKRAYGDRDPAYYDKAKMFMPCTAWLADGERALAVSRVVRLERVAAEWPAVAERVGAPAALPWVNRAGAGAPGEAAERLDETSRAILAARFADDFAQLGYSATEPDAVGPAGGSRPQPT